MRCHLEQPPRVCLSYCRDGGLLRKSSLVSLTAQRVAAGMLDATVGHGRPPRRQAAPAPERALLNGAIQSSPGAQCCFPDRLSTESDQCPAGRVVSLRRRRRMPADSREAWCDHAHGHHLRARALLARRCPVCALALGLRVRKPFSWRRHPVRRREQRHATPTAQRSWPPRAPGLPGGLPVTRRGTR